MMKLLLLAADMIQEAGLGEIGVDLFISTLPADITKGVMLRNSLKPTLIDEGMQGFSDTEFQVIVRDTDPAQGYERADNISKILNAYRMDRSGLSVSWMRRTSLPIQYAKGNGDDIETSVRIQVGFGEIPA